MSQLEWRGRGPPVADLCSLCILNLRSPCVTLLSTKSLVVFRQFLRKMKNFLYFSHHAPQLGQRQLGDPPWRPLASADEDPAERAAEHSQRLHAAGPRRWVGGAAGVEGWRECQKFCGRSWGVGGLGAGGP